MIKILVLPTESAVILSFCPPQTLFDNFLSRSWYGSFPSNSFAFRSQSIIKNGHVAVTTTFFQAKANQSTILHWCLRTADFAQLLIELKANAGAHAEILQQFV